MLPAERGAAQRQSHVRLPTEFVELQRKAFAVFDFARIAKGDHSSLSFETPLSLGRPSEATYESGVQCHKLH